MFAFLRIGRFLLGLSFGLCVFSVTTLPSLAQNSPYAPQEREQAAQTQPLHPQQTPAFQTQLASNDSPAYVADNRTERAPTGQLGQPVTPGQQPPAAQRQQPAPPFQLSEVEQQFVRQILEMWEQRGDEVKTFNSDFERLDYNLAFGQADRPLTRSSGQLSYSKPDKGSFKIKEVKRWVADDPQNTAQDAPGNWVVQKDEIGEHWVCDGKAIYEYFHPKKQLRVQPIPPEMRGEDIVNGPLPFLFGAKADELQQRYWIRAKQGNPKTIWLEAHPKRQDDAANYRMVDIMLDRKSMLPSALQVYDPNGQNRSVYVFEKPTVNGTLDGLLGSLFSAPRTPLGWKRVVERGPEGPQAFPQAKQSDALQR